MLKQRVVVIGAGIAGLAAAYSLQKQGLSVIVLESTDRVGGRICTDIAEGCTIDTGAQFFSSGYKNILALIKEVGLTSLITEVSQYCAVIKNGRPCKLRFNQPLTLLTSGLLSLPAWSNFIWRSIMISLATRFLPLDDYSAWHNFDDQNSPDFYKRLFGEDVYNYIIEPMLEGLYFQSPVDTSRALPMAVSMFPIRKHKIMTLLGGLEALPRALANSLDVRLNSPVHKINVRQDKVVITTNRFELEAEHVILAIPAPAARTLYNDADEMERTIMNTRYSATVNIAIGTQKPIESAWAKEIYGILVPGIERQAIAAIAIESNKCRSSASQGQLLNVMLSDKHGEEYIDKSDDKLLAVIMPELESYFPGLSNSIAFTRLYRWRQAEPRSPIGRSKAIYLYRTKTDKGRVLLAGDYLSMPYTEGAAESGLWAARKITKNLQSN